MSPKPPRVRIPVDTPQSLPKSPAQEIRGDTPLPPSHASNPKRNQIKSLNQVRSYSASVARTRRLSLYSTVGQPVSPAVSALNRDFDKRRKPSIVRPATQRGARGQEIQAGRLRFATHRESQRGTKLAHPGLTQSPDPLPQPRLRDRNHTVQTRRARLLH